MELISLGYAAQLFQQSPNTIRRALEKSGRPPKQIVNGVEHYEYGDVKEAVATMSDGGKR